jgi:hypothetical protein
MMTNLENGNDLIVFSSHAFGSSEVRTSKLMAQFVKRKRVYFFESPIIGVAKEATYFLRKNEHEVTVIQPYLPEDISVFEHKQALLNILKELIQDENICHYTIWTDTPKSMPFIRNLNSEIIIYDCLKNYSETNSDLEEELFQYADLTLTTGLTEKRKTGMITKKSSPAFLYLVPCDEDEVIDYSDYSQILYHY